ncbi:intraflagellar transport 57 [Brevipalpus obovatus]|uniref:intraflagellar transport 57 n=1 Tax=Brevipalpus obovatus TaxID=246614 RepID=UPI003D9F41A8
MSGEDDTLSPGYHFMSNFQASHNLTDKLVLLGYQDEFCSQYKFQPIHRYYFAVQTNPGEQFYLFSCLASWLIKDKCHLSMSVDLNPQDFEDPNVIIHTILDSVHQLDENISSTSFSPHKLKQGFGYEVIAILDKLADDALAKNYTPSSSINIKDTMGGSKFEELNDDDGQTLEEDDNIEMTHDYLHETLTEDGLMESDKEGADGKESVPYELLNSDGKFPVNEQDWKLEIERVLPQLKSTIRFNENRLDWRNRAREIHTLQKEMEKSFSIIEQHLTRVKIEAIKCMEKISSRENYLQLQLGTQINEYISLKNNLDQAAENYSQVSGGLTSKSRQLSEISDELTSIKEEMEERGNSMTDGTPLLNLRKAVQKMKQEVVFIDVRIGVSLHTLLKIRLTEVTKDAISKQNFTRKYTSSVF